MKINPVSSILTTKKNPECNIVIGSCPVQIGFLAGKLGHPAQEVKAVTTDMVLPGKLWQVDHSGWIQVEEKRMDLCGLWDAQQSLEPGSPAVLALVVDVGRTLGIKVTKEQAEAVQWKLYEGSGEIRNLQCASMELTQWLQLPSSPPIEWPWQNPRGHLELRPLKRALKAYQAHLAGDHSRVTRMDMSKVTKWALDKSAVSKTLDILDGSYDEDTTIMLIRLIWEGVAKSTPSRNKGYKKKITK